MLNSITIVNKNKDINTDISLPLSKSISNRLMMIYAINNWDDTAIEYSDSDDSRLLKYLLEVIKKNKKADFEEDPLQLNCKNAGTVFRFLTPYLCNIDKSFVLTGSQRMQERPIEPLVTTLLNMGADILYCDNENFPPLCINNGHLSASNIELDISKSSQFASALLLMLPSWFENSKLSFLGEISSQPYILMTLKLMQYYGIDYEFIGNEISLEGTYIKTKEPFKVEADWSSASYWYEVLALSRKGELFLQSLYLDSVQGDVVLANIFESLGVKTYQREDGILIRAEGEIKYNQSIDFKDYPDIAPAVIIACAGLGVMGKFIGLESLNLKESKRMDVLCRELDKLGFDLRDNGFGEYILINSCRPEVKSLDFADIEIITDDDHRMVMAFAPMAIIGESIQLSHPNSVFKSYPSFWDEMSKIFTLV